MNELIEIWKSQPVAYSRDELEEIYRRKVIRESRRLTRIFVTDLMLALLVAVLTIAAAFLANLQYKTELALVMGSFALFMTGLYILKQRMFRKLWNTSGSVKSMITDGSLMLERLIWTYRITIPLITAGLYLAFTFEFRLVSPWHVIWILVITIVLTEWLIRYIYARTIRNLNDLSARWNEDNPDEAL